MAAEGRAPSGPPPLTADDLARLRLFSLPGSPVLRLLDMVDGYQALVRRIGNPNGECLPEPLAALLDAALTAGQEEDTQ